MNKIENTKSITKNHNETDIDQMINDNKYLVDIIVTKYNNAPLEKEDLTQEGMIGLFAAIKSYDRSKNTKFETYASQCINNSIKSAISKVSRLKDIPQSALVSIDDSNTNEVNTYLSAEDEYMANESVSIIGKILYEELSEFENEVLRLYITGFSYNDIAAKLDKNSKSIDNAMQRIRKKLEKVSF